MRLSGRGQVLIRCPLVLSAPWAMHTTHSGQQIWFSFLVGCSRLVEGIREPVVRYLASGLVHSPRNARLMVARAIA